MFLTNARYTKYSSKVEGIPMKKNINRTFSLSGLVIIMGIYSLLFKNQLIGLGMISIGMVFLLLSKNMNNGALDFSVLEADQHFKDLCQLNDKIAAVKYCRSKVHCGLKEALDYVETIRLQ